MVCRWRSSRMADCWAKTCLGVSETIIAHLEEPIEVAGDDDHEFA
jgi:hypothetical protein